MITDLQKSLDSALFKLHEEFGDDSELLHEAVSIVFSSIFRKYGLESVVSGYNSNKFNWIQLLSVNSLMSISIKALFIGIFSNNDTLATCKIV